MSILKISRLGHPILLEKTNPVKNIPDKEIKKIIYDMSETMIDAKGIGLATPQVYINKQIMIFRTFNEDSDENNEIKITRLEKNNHYNRELITTLKKRKLKLKDKQVSLERQATKEAKEMKFALGM